MENIPSESKSPKPQETLAQEVKLLQNNAGHAADLFILTTHFSDKPAVCFIDRRMIFKKLLFFKLISFLALLSYSDGYAQRRTALTFIVESNPIQTQVKKGDAHKHFAETSEIKLFATGFIRLYQLFISTQDMPSCNFTPSCSRFGMKSIQKCGFFRGILLTSDRLQRCHSAAVRYSPRYYTFDETTGRLFNAVENYSRGALDNK